MKTRAISLLLTVTLLISLLLALSVTQASANGYDNGYTEGRLASGSVVAYGADLSYYQGPKYYSGRYPDFKKMKADGYDFVILRVAHGNFVDPDFPIFYELAHAAGLDVGAYYFTTAMTAEEAVIEAKEFLRLLGGRKLEYPAYVDWENGNGDEHIVNKYTRTQTYEVTMAFMDTVAAAGYLTGIYTLAVWGDIIYPASEWFPVPLADIGKKYDVWVANYAGIAAENASHYPENFGMHQYGTPAYGYFSALDHDVCYKDYPKIVKTYGFNNYPSRTRLVDGKFTISSSRDPGYVLGVTNNGTKSGVNVELQKYDPDNDFQKFVLTRQGTTEYYTLRNVATGLNLHVYGGSKTSGTNVVLATKSTSNAQKWRLSPNDNDTYTLVSALSSNVSLHLNGSEAVGGANINIYTTKSAPDEDVQWNLNRISDFEEGLYRFDCSKNRAYTMSVLEDSYSDGQAANLHKDTFSSYWQVNRASDGFYTLRNYHTGLYLELPDTTLKTGAKLIQTDTKTMAHLWSFVPNADGSWSLASAANDLYLDVTGGTMANGTRLQVSTSSSTSTTQKWFPVVHTHSYTPGAVTEPTCSRYGYVENTCACGNFYYEYTSILPHTPVVDAAVMPTCTDEGLTEGTHCSVCNSVVTKQEPVAALGHDMQACSGTDATCTTDGLVNYQCTRCSEQTTKYLPALGHDMQECSSDSATCTTDGLVNYQCSRCPEQTTKYLPALGHDMQECSSVGATCTTDGYVTYSCTRCPEETTTFLPATGHFWGNGTVTRPAGPGTTGEKTYSCIYCGTKLTQTIPALPKLSIKEATISLDSAITMNFYVAESSLKGWEEPYLVFTRDRYDANGNVIGTVTETVTDYYSAATSAGLPARVYCLEGITSVEMCSEVSATLCATANGETYSGNAVSYSVLRYVSSKLPYANEDFAAVLVDMVRYGAAAQLYWGCNTANLPTAILTEAYEAFGHTGETSIVSKTSQIKDPDSTVGFKYVTLGLEDRVTVNYYLNLTKYQGEIEDLKVVLTYGDKTAEITELAYLPYAGAMYHVAQFDQLTSSELRTLINAEVYSKTTGEKLSGTLTYSAESYAASKLGDAAIRPVLHAMLNFSDSAKAFFG